MLITLRQVPTKGAICLEAEGPEGVRCRVRAPRTGLSAPFRPGHTRRLSLTGPDGAELLYTQYRAVENLARSLGRYQRPAVLSQYLVCDQTGRTLGGFQTHLDRGLAGWRELWWGEVGYRCFAQALGAVEVLTLWAGESQIGQITRPLDSWHQRAVLYLHLVESAAPLVPLLCLFVLGMSLPRLRQAGRVALYGAEKRRAYTRTPHAGRYDPDWVGRTFGPAEAARLDRLLQTHPERGAGCPPAARRLALGVGVGIALLAAAALVLALWLGLI